MEEHRELNEKYAEIAAELIKKEPLLSDIRQSEATIVYLSSDKPMKSKGKLVGGQCERIDPKYKWAIPADFTITIFEPNIITFSDDQLKVLIFHELLHVKIEFMSDGTEKYGINPHDVEEFRAIIDRFGIDWDLPEWSEADGTE